MSRPDVWQFKEYLDFLDSYADLRGDRGAEIMTQMGGALAFLSAIPFVQPARTPYTLELLAAALRLANAVEMRFKQALASRRPMEYSPQVQPMILTPSHSTFPSGHATEAFTSAYVLWRLLRATNVKPYADTSWRIELMRLASRVAVNRTVAGVHFPVDSAAGCFLGLRLGRFFWKRCTAPNAGADFWTYEFDGSAYPVPSGGLTPPDDGDFYWEAIWDALFAGGSVPYINYIESRLVHRSDLLRWLWRKARDEWRTV
jgi:hypothetical protein